MPGALHRDAKAALAGEANGDHDILGGASRHYDLRPVYDSEVKRSDLAGVSIGSVHPTRQALSKLGNGRFLQSHLETQW